MPRKIDWNSMDANGPKGAGTRSKGLREFISFKAGKDEKLRPIGGGIEFAKFFNRSTKKSIIVDLEDSAAVSQLIADKTGVEIKGSHRYAINVLDRSDSNKCKVCEGSFSVFSQFGSWSQEMSKEHEEDVGVGHGKYGGNWKIKVLGEGKARRYSATFLGAAPITKEESEMITSMRKVKLPDKDEVIDALDLNVVFRVCPKDKILEWLFGEEYKSENSGSESSGSSGAEETVEASAEQNYNF